MSERPAPGILSGLRHALEDAEITSKHPHTIRIKCVSPNRAARIARILADLQKEGPDE